MNEARKGLYKDNPIIIFMDEAHQFLNKSIADEYFSAKPLDAFEQISKEARKYGLFLCIATQMPRDIPLGTLSQMGTFVVHRLINEQDKKAVENVTLLYQSMSPVSDAVSEQYATIQTVVDNAQVIAAGIEESNAAVNEVNNTVSHIQQRTERLKNLIEQFKTNR